MNTLPHRRWRLVIASAGLLTLGGLLAGCSKNAELSQKDVAEMKQGAPKEMPAEARAIMERANRGAGAQPR